MLSTAYPEHAACLARVNKDLDCFGVYPQMIPLSFYYTFHMDINPAILYQVMRVTQQEHMLIYSLSRHLYAAAACACSCSLVSK